MRSTLQTSFFWRLAQSLPPTLIWISSVLLFAWACSDIELGENNGPNDAVPTGTVISQGSFEGRNGQTVTGSAIVYRSGAGSYILRIQALTAPNESGISVELYANGNIAYSTTLNQASGSQNFSFSYSGGENFESVVLRSGLATPPTDEYGYAQLSSQNQSQLK